METIENDPSASLLLLKKRIKARTSDSVRPNTCDALPITKDAIRFVGAGAISDRDIMLVFGGTYGTKTSNIVLSTNVPLPIIENIKISYYFNLLIITSACYFSKKPAILEEQIKTPLAELQGTRNLVAGGTLVWECQECKEECIPIRAESRCIW